MSTIAAEQAENPKPKRGEPKDALIHLPLGQIWILNESNYLHMRLLVIVQISAAGHRGQRATLSALTSLFH